MKVRKMSKSWRPDNWVNPYPDTNWDEGLQHEGFEQGADAMLESLRKAPCDGTQIISGGIWEGKNGFPYRLLFIPRC